MRLRISTPKPAERFIDPDIDPNADYEPLGPTDALFANAPLDPALLLQNYDVQPELLAQQLAQTSLANLLRQQQFIVFDVASRVGVLSSYVDKARTALQAFDVIIDNPSIQKIVQAALNTAIGLTTDVLSAVPVYGQIGAAILSLGQRMYAILNGPTGQLQRALIPAQEYSGDTDVAQYNNTVRPVMQGFYDWSTIFSPRYNGQLTAQVRMNDADQFVLAWALGNGQVPTPLMGDMHLVKNEYGWQLIENFDFNDGSFADTNLGLGMLPGGERIYGIVQQTISEKPVGPAHNHPTLFDPRCSTTGTALPKTETIDIGSYYPITTQGAQSLWTMCFQKGASMYCLDAGTILQKWEDYFDAIWEGVHELWHNSIWEGEGGKNGLPGWGCGVWESALQDLVRNYTVGLNNEIGLLSWAPSRTGALKSSDTDKWNDNNVYKKIIQPAIFDLREAQLWYLRKTTIAAYLPIEGGKDADPLAQDKVMGAMRDPLIAKEFYDARHRILNGASKHDVRLDDVLDLQYRQQIKQAGGGTDGPEPLGFTAGPPNPYIAVPKGGNGFHPPRWPYNPHARRPSAKAAAVAGLLLAAGSAWYWRADLQSWWQKR